MKIYLGSQNSGGWSSKYSFIRNTSKYLAGIATKVIEMGGRVHIQYYYDILIKKPILKIKA